MNDPIVDAGISRGERFWASYSHISSTLPYGEHMYGPSSWRDVNGKNGALALAFSLHTNRVSEAKYHGRMTVLGHINEIRFIII